MDRLTEFFNQLVRKAVEFLPYAGHYPYSVVACNTATQTLSARSLDPMMPDVTDVPMVSPGLILNVPPGTQVKIGFAGMNPNAPYVASYGVGAMATTPAGISGSSGISNIVAGGYLVTGQNVSTFALLPPQFFPAGTAGQLAANAAALAITTGGNTAFVTDLTGGRISLNAWTVP